ncbi:adenylate cyclase, class 2 [Halogranum amylolyticum]|uniref:Adenylate cyclase, class 2 n=1 Tax=Halogranum amylolyticum TaxID=660520 RepID=A0A1H8T7L0_9EURY|nr:class IV adenylate cyclase [Halogranum amylolyticum]SEO86891.1 adenylate cyclase, class 2 [Halogranum amylolyticum]
MYEVELKVEATHDAVRERLSTLAADHLGSVEQVDTYYDAPHRDFAETDEALRLRRETDRETGETTTKVTYKGPLVESASKTREEFETAVDDDESMAGVLDGLGFDPAAVVEKDREFYAVDGYTVTLDAVADLGEFVEVERETEKSEIEDVREGAVTLLRELGLDPDEQIRTSYLGLLLENSCE